MQKSSRAYLDKLRSYLETSALRNWNSNNNNIRNKHEYLLSKDYSEQILQNRTTQDHTESKHKTKTEKINSQRRCEKNWCKSSIMLHNVARVSDWMLPTTVTNR